MGSDGLYSMTGYGSSTYDSSEYKVTVELKSVNHRFREINIRMPRQLLKMEDKLKRKISEYISRGRVEVFVSIEGEGLTHKGLHIDWKLLDDYHQFIHDINHKYNLSAKIDIKDLLSNDKIVEVIESEEVNVDIDQLVLKAAEDAVKHLVEMREVEGKELLNDLERQLDRTIQLLNEIKQYAPSVTIQYKNRIEKRIKEYTGGLIDETRLLTEVGIYAEKADINEELTRLESHVAQFRDTIYLNAPIGRKLDFMIQEMNREINTIGSKANQSDISSNVVELKTTIEKMREQVQNIE